MNGNCSNTAAFTPLCTEDLALFTPDIFSLSSNLKTQTRHLQAQIGKNKMSRETKIF